METSAVVTASAAARGGELSPRAQEILQQIADPLLRDRVEQTATLCLKALQALRHIHLPQDHFEEALERAELAAVAAHHSEMAPYVLAAVAGLNELLRYIFATFPAPAAAAGGQSDGEAAGGGAPAGDMADFDVAFDLVDGPTGEGPAAALLAAPRPPRVGTPVAAAVPAAALVAEVLHSLAALLRARLVKFAERLRFALAQPHNWALLAELDEHKRRLEKAVQGIFFGQWALFAPEARREELLPQYRSAVSEAVQLRTALADLTHQVRQYNRALAQVEQGQELPWLVALADQLRRFSSRPEYRTLRSDDKKAVIDFRTMLHHWRQHPEGISGPAVCQAVDGFAKFLEALQAINWREVLVVHDKTRLEHAGRLLQAAAQAASSAAGVADAIVKLAEALAELKSVRGRNEALDGVVGAVAAQGPFATPAQLTGAVNRLAEAARVTQETLGA